MTKGSKFYSIEDAYKHGYKNGQTIGREELKKELREKIEEYKTKVLNDKDFNKVCNPDCHIFAADKILNFLK